MRMWMMMTAMLVGSASTVAAQAPGGDPIEIPLRVEDGRLMVTVDGPDGGTYDFVLGLGMTLITESGAARMGDDISALTLAGLPVVTEQATTVPDAQLGGGDDTPAGVLGGLTLNMFDVLVDAPNGRMVLKPVGRSVRWPGVTLSNPVAIQLFHDVMVRADVEVDGKLYGGFVELASPYMEVNAPLEAAGGVTGEVLGAFRLGYSGWTDLPAKVTDHPNFKGWDRESQGFVYIGAPVAYECAIAISWVHSELRTCLR